jgi:hypothetical protein
LRLSWCLLDVVATWWQYRWLQHPLQCVYNHWCAAIAKKQLQNQHVGDCNFVAVWLHPYSSVFAIEKKQLQKQVRKCDCKKPVKKAPCHDTVRLRLGWCLLNVVATWWKYGWL